MGGDTSSSTQEHDIRELVTTLKTAQIGQQRWEVVTWCTDFGFSILFIYHFESHFSSYLKDEIIVKLIYHKYFTFATIRENGHENEHNKSL